MGTGRLFWLLVQDQGPHVIGYQSTPSKLTYKEADKFAAFLAEEGLSDVLSQHQARGLPMAGFSEKFTRYAKALVHMGDRAPRCPIIRPCVWI